MKKSFFLCAAYIIAGTSVNAQNDQVKELQKAPSTNMELAELPPPPPAPEAMYSDALPPEAPLPPAPPAPPAVPERVSLAPAPPAPPTPPAVPVPPREINSYYQTRAVNSTGSEISVHLVKNEEVVFIRKDETIKKVKMSTWNANRKMYEQKYGHLPFSRPVKK